MTLVNKLIVTADIHGNYNSWKRITEIIGPRDGLIIAGDLFDTKYGSYGQEGYDPDRIRKEVELFQNPFFYVYGNCDQEHYLKGFSDCMTFGFMEKTIMLQHGHVSNPLTSNPEIIIQGHSHVKNLEKKNGIYYLNPGSPTSPRDNLASFGEITKSGITLKKINGSVISRLGFKCEESVYEEIFSRKCR